jgi:hypothetical protein
VKNAVPKPQQTSISIKKQDNRREALGLYFAVDLLIRAATPPRRPFKERKTPNK